LTGSNTLAYDKKIINYGRKKFCIISPQVMEHQFANLEKQVWENVANLEDSECVRRFLCEVAAEGFEAPEYAGLVENIVVKDEVGIGGAATYVVTTHIVMTLSITM
jgi:hypothetical protein